MAPARRNPNLDSTSDFLVDPSATATDYDAGGVSGGRGDVRTHQATQVGRQEASGGEHSDAIQELPSVQF
jgi:hypothetical protein